MRSYLEPNWSQEVGQFVATKDFKLLYNCAKLHQWVWAANDQLAKVTFKFFPNPGLETLDSPWATLTLSSDPALNKGESLWESSYSDRWWELMESSE